MLEPEEGQEVFEFSAQSVNEALAAARQQTSPAEFAAESTAESTLAESGEMEIAAQCISVTVQNRKVCINLPLGIGRVCLPVPGFIPNGQAAQACLSICTTFGIPTGVKVTVSVAGQVIVRKSFGKC